MAKIEEIRHSLAHVLAAAVEKKYPGVKFGIGPVIADGFYYDFQFPAGQKIGNEDLPELEAEMNKIIKGKYAFRMKEISVDEARKTHKDQPFKLELIGEFASQDQKITVCETENVFTDLCRGGHVKDTSEINPEAFALTHLAGAYWRGNEKREMLTRIYGVAFETKEELEAHLKLCKEAARRDHKKLGKELDLFVFSPLIGPGLPVWTPRGTLVRNLLDDFVWSLRQARGYERVDIPHITKKDLYEKSGHWDKFKDELFRMRTREEHEFALKPMNCPHHTQIFARRKWSYRELPQRYASTTKCYRDEQTGELSGLTRLRAFTQDDAHVFCGEDQVKNEAFKIWDIINAFYGAFGFEMKVRLSMHDPKHMERYLGDVKEWGRMVQEMREWLKERKADYFDGVGEAAFYGPKVDFIAKDSLGREWQVATLQVDKNMPERFDLTYIGKDGKENPVVMLHAAIMGAIERFLAILIEHTAGAFPLWLSPVQVKVLPVSDKHNECAEKVIDALRTAGLRAELDDSSETLGKKIRAAELDKAPYILILGDKEVSAESVAVRQRGEGDTGSMKLNDFIRKVQGEVQDKT